MAYFYYKDGVLHRVENGYQYPEAKFLPQNETESISYAKSLKINLQTAKIGVLTKAK